MGGRVQPVVFSVLLLGALSGCTFFDESGDGFDLNVEFDVSKNTIIETYSDGELESLSGVSVDFDFSNTTTDLQLIGVDKNDGSDAVEKSLDRWPDFNRKFPVAWKYNLTIYAVSEAGEKETLTTQLALTSEYCGLKILLQNPRPWISIRFQIMLASIL